MTDTPQPREENVPVADPRQDAKMSGKVLAGIRRVLYNGFPVAANFVNTLTARAPFVKTDTSIRTALNVMSSEATNPAGLTVGLTGAAAQVNRTVSIQTQEQGVANAGVLALQAFGGSTAIYNSNLDPWRVEIAPFTGLSASTNWATRTVDATFFFNGYRASTGAQNALISVPVVLSAGTWNVILIHGTGPDRGIYSFDLDGTAVFGTIDGYSAGAVANVVTAGTGTVIATTGKKILTVTMATKNAASAAYFGVVSQIILLRTA